ncbi:MAG: DmsE family decaheme c-type cytochrome [Actinomycetota bacterium]|nr:DmsE family decaheme c-type cytochrome [Actinomycetota bacterium]
MGGAQKRPVFKALFSLIVFLSLFFSGCEALRQSRPILPMRQYEKMVAGRLDADYVGTKTCLSACHYHDQLKKDFDASTMGVQIRRSSGLPLVNCESCHGPGSLAIKGITPEKVAADAKRGIQTACNYKTFIDIKHLPPQAQTLICLKCHTENATFNLHNWNAGPHAQAGVSCIDCHKVHNGPDLKTMQRDIASMCFKCHKEVKAEFSLPSHHPVNEGRVFCTDCHDPMGSINEKMLRRPTVKQTCTRCHGEKEGPFAFEHSENTEDCRTCHRPHGSVNANLLVVPVPFLCLQCHAGHRISSSSAPGSVSTFYTRCTDCHSQIHGTDLPSASGSGFFHR